MTSRLLTPLKTNLISLPNRVVMAPMNRRRAVNGVPTESMITYYVQRSDAGLITTDNTAISANGGAYLNTPGIYTSEQKLAWKKIVDAVHVRGGKIFLQLVHSGRVGHSAIQDGAPLVAPSAIRVNENIRVPDGTHQQMDMPIAIPTAEIPLWIASFVQASVNAMEAGFDGVEIHAAHGFLIDQFISPWSNLRTDRYGGNIENRIRFLVEVMGAVSAEIGKEKTGIRLSPFREIYDLKPYSQELATHQLIMDELQKLDILYVHFSNAMVNGQPTIPKDYLQDARKRFKNLIIVAGGFDIACAEEVLASGLADLVAMGKLYISNPDLIERIKYNLPLASWDENTFYTGGDKGYIDYPKHQEI